nr:acetoacetate decarboxylase family protein [Sulfolobus islandicus]
MNAPFSLISSSFRVSEVWRGEGEVILNGSINEELEVLKVNKIEGGYYFNWSFKQLGAKILSRISK